MEGVALQDAGAGAGRVDELGAVVAQHGDLVAHAGKHALAAAGETGEEVGLNEALGDQQVGLSGHLVDDQLGAGGEHADLHVAFGVPAVVADELLLVGDLLAHLVHQLLVAGGAVEAGGDEEGDVDVGVALPQLGEHEGEDVLAGHRAGVIADDDGGGLLALGQLGELGGADGIGHGLFDDVVFAALGLQRPDGGLQDFCPGHIPAELQTGGAKGDSHVDPSSHNFDAHSIAARHDQPS